MDSAPTGQLPASGSPDEILPGVRALVDDMVGAASVSTFFISRAGDLDEAHSRHTGSRLVALYVTDKPHHAVLVEDALTDAYQQNPRFDDNIILQEGDPEEPTGHVVYLALWTSGEPH